VQSSTGAAERYRWGMLVLCFLGGFAQGLLWLSQVSFVLVIERELRLSAAQTAFWMNVPLMATVLCSIPIGLLTDAWGAKWVGRVGMLCLALGGFSRGLVRSYSWLLTTTALFGVGYCILFVCLPKALAMWFPREEMGTAYGLALSGWGAGATLGLAATTPLFGNNWHGAFLASGWIGLAVALSWWLFGKDRPKREAPPGSAPARKSPSSHSFKQVIRTPLTWLLTALFFFFACGFSAWFTFGFPYVLRFKHLSATFSGTLVALTPVGYTLAALAMPALSDRLGRRKPVLFFAAALTTVLFAGLPYLRGTYLLLIASFLLGVGFGTINPLAYTIPAEAEEVGPEGVGAVLGIVISLGSLASFFVPAVFGGILGSLVTGTEHGFTLTWFLTAILSGGVFLCTLFLRETGPYRLRAASQSLKA
jgi:cyanate permease